MIDFGTWRNNNFKFRASTYEECKAKVEKTKANADRPKQRIYVVIHMTPTKRITIQMYGGIIDEVPLTYEWLLGKWNSDFKKIARNKGWILSYYSRTKYINMYRIKESQRNKKDKRNARK